jgi:predicted lipoprotein with Yx(FWY)xxD motif
MHRPRRTNATPAAAKGTAVSATSGSDGTFLTGAGGRALYLWVADAKGTSSCSGVCAKAWPPLTTKSKPVAAGSVKASQLGTIKRSDGTQQVTYDGHALYYFEGDPKSRAERRSERGRSPASRSRRSAGRWRWPH